jgi:hypothetical protein
VTVGVEVGPTSEVDVVKTSFLSNKTLLEPLMMIKAWICLSVSRLGTVPILFLIMLPIFGFHKR